MRLRDALGPRYLNPQCAPLFSPTGRPAAPPAPRALITMRQVAAGRSDAQAAAAVRARSAWQYALALAVTAPGGEASVLRECRQRLTGQAALLRCEPRWTRVCEQGWRKAQGRQRPASTPGLAALQPLKRREGSGATRRQARNVRATVAPDWRRSWVPAGWWDRSRPRGADSRWPPEQPARAPLATPLGREGRPRLSVLSAPATPAWWRQGPALETLPQVWRPPGYASRADQPGRWRHADAVPPAPLRISSPDAPEARYGTKRDPAWTGSQGHVTATGADETPQRIPAVLTTPATTSAGAGRPTMPDHLATRPVAPREQGVAAGEVRAEPLLPSRPEPGSALLGPVPGDQRWPGPAADGCAAAQLVRDWDARHAICPHGQRRVVWRERPERHGPPTGRSACSQPGCAAGARRADGPRAATAPRA
jgi:hypothetical protein